MKTLRRSLAVFLLAGAVVQVPAVVGSAATGAEAAAPDAAEPAEGAEPEPLIQITGRVIHTWHAKPNLRAILVIDGFTVLALDQQVTARDGVVWFDEAAARRVGHVTLGVYAETAVRVRRPDGQIEEYDSVYLELENGGEVRLHSDGDLRGKVDETPLYLRAKKMRGEYLATGEAEAPTLVVPAPEPPEPVEVPGIREAGVPQEITIVPQDDVRRVNFVSFVEQGWRISIWTGGVYVMRGRTEMAADNLVVWVPEDEVRRRDQPRVGAEGGTGIAAEAYLEGHVRLNIGHRTLMCSQLYYDFRREQALAIDTKIKTFSKERNVPIYYYAREVRQLAEGIFLGTNAWMTTCEFAHPHYEVGATELTLVDLTPDPAEEGEEPVYRRVRFLGKNVQMRVRHLPLTYWPRFAGDFAEGETALRTIRIENRSGFGTGVRSQWHLFRLLGIEREPAGFNFYLNADVWSERGPAGGVESEYVRKDFYGEFGSYYLHDFGEDTLYGETVEPEVEHRGRVLWRHRHYLPEDWELTMELSYITDRSFLNEFFEEEDKTGKSQETLIYLKKHLPDEAGLPSEQAVTLLTSWRVNDFYTRTEYWPQLGYNVIGRSLLDDHVTYFQDSEVAWARFRPRGRPRRPILPGDEAAPRGSGGELIADTKHEFDLPLRLDPVNIVPFVEGRASYFGQDERRRGGQERFYQRAGVRAAAQAWRVYDGVESDFWDLHGLRHINTFDVRAYAANSTVPSRELIPFDVTEAGTPVVQGVEGTGVVGLGWRQRFQTKRGVPDELQSIDWLTMDLEAFFFNNREGPDLISPDGKRALNHLDFRTRQRVTDSVTVWTDTNYQATDGTLDLFAVGMNVTHSPRMRYVIGHRYIPDGDSAMTFFSADYLINSKWYFTLLEQYDFDRQRNAQTHFILTRRLHRWQMRIRLEYDAGEDEKLVGIELRPMGVPEVRFGM